MKTEIVFALPDYIETLLEIEKNKQCCSLRRVINLEVYQDFYMVEIIKLCLTNL
jgi:hypothetical protein